MADGRTRGLQADPTCSSAQKQARYNPQDSEPSNSEHLTQGCVLKTDAFPQKPPCLERLPHTASDKGNSTHRRERCAATTLSTDLIQFKIPLKEIINVQKLSFRWAREPWPMAMKVRPLDASGRRMMGGQSFVPWATEREGARETLGTASGVDFTNRADSLVPRGRNESRRGALGASRHPADPGQRRPLQIEAMDGCANARGWWPVAMITKL